MGYTQCDRCVAKMPKQALSATVSYRNVTVPLGCPNLARALSRRARHLSVCQSHPDWSVCCA